MGLICSLAAYVVASEEPSPRWLSATCAAQLVAHAVYFRVFFSGMAVKYVARAGLLSCLLACAVVPMCRSHSLLAAFLSLPAMFVGLFCAFMGYDAYDAAYGHPEWPQTGGARPAESAGSGQVPAGNEEESGARRRAGAGPRRKDGRSLYGPRDMMDDSTSRDMDDD